MKAMKMLLTNALLVAGLAAGLPVFAQVNASFDHAQPPCAPAMPGMPGLPGGNDAHRMPPMMGDHGEGSGPQHMDGPPPMHAMPMMDAGIPPFLHVLKLSEAQEDKIFAIMHAVEPVFHEQHKVAKKSADAIHEMIEGNVQYDESKLKSLADAEARAMAQIKVAHASTMHQISLVLTPEQRTQLQSMKNEHAQGAGPKPPMH